MTREYQEASDEYLKVSRCHISHLAAEWMAMAPHVVADLSSLPGIKGRADHRYLCRRLRGWFHSSEQASGTQVDIHPAVRFLATTWRNIASLIASSAVVKTPRVYFRCSRVHIRGGPPPPLYLFSLPPIVHTSTIQTSQEPVRRLCLLSSEDPYYYSCLIFDHV